MTGVQTCALPICTRDSNHTWFAAFLGHLVLEDRRNSLVNFHLLLAFQLLISLYGAKLLQEFRIPRNVLYQLE